MKYLLSQLYFSHATSPVANFCYDELVKILNQQHFFASFWLAKYVSQYPFANQLKVGNIHKFAANNSLIFVQTVNHVWSWMDFENILVFEIGIYRAY